MNPSRIKLFSAQVGFLVCACLAFLVLAGLVSTVVAVLTNELGGQRVNSGQISISASLQGAGRVAMVLFMWMILTMLFTVVTRSELYGGLASVTLVLSDFLISRTFPSVNHLFITRNSNRLVREGVYSLDFGPSLDSVMGSLAGIPTSLRWSMLIVLAYSIAAGGFLARIVQGEEVHG